MFKVLLTTACQMIKASGLGVGWPLEVQFFYMLAAKHCHGQFTFKPWPPLVSWTIHSLAPLSSHSVAADQISP